MRQAMTLDSQMEMNPLYRKMRERFTYNNGSMTIGEIMLHRAERDGYCGHAEAQPAPAPVAAKPAVRSKKRGNALRNFVKSHSVAFTCALLTLSAILVLSLMIPFLSGPSILGENVSAMESTVAEAPVEEVQEVPVVEEETSVSVSSFANVMDAFNYDFGN